MVASTAEWLEGYRRFWEESFNRLDEYLIELKKKEKKMVARKNSPATETAERELVITRIFDAPRDLVWKTWTEPKHVAEWWGPKGFTARVTELDLRVGGTCRYVMVGPDGAEYPAKGVFREIVPPERFVSSDEFDEGFSGEAIPGIVITATFDDMGDKTKLTLHIRHESAEDRKKHEEMGVVGGWHSSFDCLDEYLYELKTRR